MQCSRLGLALSALSDRVRGRARSLAGRGLVDARPPRCTRGCAPVRLAWLTLLVGCAAGEDKGTGFTVGTLTQVTSASNPFPEATTSGATSPSDDSSLPTSAGDGSGDSNDSDGPPTFECGNGVLDPNEECEGDDLDAQTCDSFGFSGGALRCAADCRYDTSMCSAATVCGDGVIDVEERESCDCGGQGGVCTPAQLGGLTCVNFDGPKGVAFGGGTLGCNSPVACSFNIDGCTYCGDGQRNGPEDCDGGDLGGQTCLGLGFDGGSLSCNVGCTHNTTACESFSCGDQQCQPGEDSCVCPEDCPEDPNTCSACECGGQGGPNCYCDIFCVLNFDCCLGGPC